MPERIAVSSTRRHQMCDITAQVNDALRRLGADRGVCHIYVPHTTAGIVINENADPAVCADILEWLDAAVPQHDRYRHAEGNAPAHIKAALVGQSAAVPIEAGRLALGTWQGVFLAEFDGPRRRTVVIEVSP